MKAEDRLKELVESGEINSLDAAKQEGFIQGWNEALRIHDVVGRSEQLKAFVDFYNSRQNSDKRVCSDEIDIYLESL